MFLILVSVAWVFRWYLSQLHFRVGAAHICMCYVIVGTIAFVLYADGHDTVITMNPEKLTKCSRYLLFFKWLYFLFCIR